LGFSEVPREIDIDDIVILKVGRGHLWECEMIDRIQIHFGNPERVHRFLELFVDGSDHILHQKDDLVWV